jgi:hypothetical protein
MGTIRLGRTTSHGRDRGRDRAGAAAGAAAASVAAAAPAASTLRRETLLFTTPMMPLFLAAGGDHSRARPGGRRAAANSLRTAPAQTVGRRVANLNRTFKAHDAGRPPFAMNVKRWQDLAHERERPRFRAAEWRRTCRRLPACHAPGPASVEELMGAPSASLG